MSAPAQLKHSLGSRLTRASIPFRKEVDAVTSVLTRVFRRARPGNDREDGQISDLIG